MFALRDSITLDPQYIMELCVHPSQAPVLDATTTCTFLDVVPLEIREMIYRYVLVVKTEHNMNSLEVRL